MSDKEILDWIESELNAMIGCGDFWCVMHDVHKGVLLRDAVEAQIVFLEKLDAARKMYNALGNVPDARSTLAICDAREAARATWPELADEEDK